MADIQKLEKELWEAADNLRANSKLTSQQYCMPVLGLIFLRYAWGRFIMVDEQIKAKRAQSTGRQIPIEPDDYAKRGAMYLPPKARYDYLVNLPEDEANIGTKVNDAMEAIEKVNPQLSGILPHDYTELGNDLLRDTLRIFNNKALDEGGDDILGRIYEYFLGKFESDKAFGDGIFFTPKSIVRLIMNVIEPERGVMLDPACGSGGMFVSASDYVREHGGKPSEVMTFYGQEKVEFNAKICLMNMAVHGMNGSILSGDQANTFYHDAHSLDGQCDYVVANPPFNVNKVKAEEAQEAGRMPLGISGINKSGEFSNANYLWINYFYSYLRDENHDEGKKGGRAGFVMASSATDSANKDRLLRENLVRSGHVDVMLYVGKNFFYTKSLPCTLWFLDKGKQRDKVLFIDAQNYHTVLDTTHNEWSPWQLKNLSAIVWLYRGEADKYSALLEEYCAEIRGMVKLVDGDTKDVFANVAALDDFTGARDALAAYIDARKEKAEADVDVAKARDRKRLRAAYDEEIAELEGALIVIGEALWLTEKFGVGEYADIPGLCKVATQHEIEEKNWNLTPGAYVGRTPQEDDGIDFHERMGEIHEELLRLQAESNELMATISHNFEELGI